MPSSSKLLAGGLLLISGVVISYQFILPWFRVSHINCQLEQQTCPQELVEQLAGLQESPFFLTDHHAKISQLNLELYQLDSWSKKWPHQLNLVFTRRTSDIVIAFAGNNQLYQLGQLGVLVPVETAQNQLPITISDWPLAVEDNRLAVDLNQVLIDLSTGLTQHQLQPSEVIISGPQQIELIFNDFPRAILDADQTVTQLSKLKIIQDQVELDTIDLAIKQIDLRFELPVLQAK